MDAINPSKLNRVSHKGAKLKAETFENKLSKMIDNVRVEAERRVCEYGSFAPVKANVLAKDKSELLQEVVLQVVPLPKSLKEKTPNYEKLRYIELVGMGNKGQIESVVLARGTKDEIMQNLNDVNFPSKVQDEVEEFRRSFLED